MVSAPARKSHSKKCYW